MTKARNISNEENPTLNPEMLVLARESLGWTQSRLSKEAGISQAMISKLEKGLIEVNYEIVKKLNKVLNHSVEFFAKQMIFEKSYSSKI